MELYVEHSFHFRNGASLYRVNFGANPTVKGYVESFGLMANYYYDVKGTSELRGDTVGKPPEETVVSGVDRLQQNREAYIKSGTVHVWKRVFESVQHGEDGRVAAQSKSKL